MFMKRLDENQPAIGFSLTDYRGRKITLSNYQGKKVLLSFFRAASCPFCNLRVHQLIKHYEELKEHNIELIALFASSGEEILEYAGKQDAPFPIIPDPNLELYKKYGVEQSRPAMFKTMMRPVKMMRMMFSGFFNIKSLKEEPIVPADFLIDERQRIYRAYYGKDFGDHIPLDTILTWGKS